MNPWPAGIEVRDLSVFADERGEVRHFLRADAPHFQGFGEVYFSTVFHKRWKGWRRHRQATANLTVPAGEIRLYIWDDRDGSPSRDTLTSLVLGQDHYRLVTIAPGLWTGFRGVSSQPAVVANCLSLPYDRTEIESLDPEDPTAPYVPSPR